MVGLKLPWRAATAIDPVSFARVRRRTLFEACKWDPQVEDVSTLSAFPLVLRREAWREIACLAGNLAAEAAAAEVELLQKPRLARKLGFSRVIGKVLQRASRGASSPGAARVMRFDFHFTTEGWRISEVNSDVPGGFNEASGFTSILAANYPGAETCGDPAGEWANAIATATEPEAVVALVHATAFTDDRQVMVFLSRQLEARGRRPVLTGPDHLRWRDGHAFVESDYFKGPVSFLVRFYPAEWLSNLPRSSGWSHFFHGARTPASNPAYALLTQTKRFPLAWNDLECDLRTWREMLPETRHPGDVDWKIGEGWVLKPALGRVGEWVGLAGVTEKALWKTIQQDARRRPEGWVAQRRFEAVPLLTEAGDYFPCFGVFTIEGRAAGVYGRVAREPLIDHRAQDAAVLVERACEQQPDFRQEFVHESPAGL
jgi:glutathionylspermidine synthase